MSDSQAEDVAVATYDTPPAPLVRLLAKQLPHSLPLLRRLQFTRFPGGITEHTHILWASDAALGAGDDDNDLLVDTVFAAAYVDLSRGPETEVWLYSSLEHLAPACPYTSSSSSSSSEAAEQRETTGGAQALAVVRAVRRIRDAWPAKRALGPADVLVGDLAETTRCRLAQRGVVFSTHSAWDKWLFRLAELPGGAVEAVRLEPGMRWGVVAPEHFGLVLSRSKVRRKERTLALLPSTALTLADGTPIAWCFLGPGASLASLHCEEPYRGRGYAKAVAVRILQHHLRDYGDDGLAAAEVAPDNASSQGVCRSLGGKILWTVSWSTMDLTQSFRGR